jgi:hypothetical protein
VDPIANTVLAQIETAASRSCREKAYPHVQELGIAFSTDRDSLARNFQLARGYDVTVPRDGGDSVTLTTRGNRKPWRSDRPRTECLSLALRSGQELLPGQEIGLYRSRDGATMVIAADRSQKTEISDPAAVAEIARRVSQIAVNLHREARNMRPLSAGLLHNIWDVDPLTRVPPRAPRKFASDPF